MRTRMRGMVVFSRGTHVQTGDDMCIACRSGNVGLYGLCVLFLGSMRARRSTHRHGNKRCDCTPP